MKYKVGDKVMLKTWDSMEKEYGLRSDGAIALWPCVNEIDMKRYCGKLTEITHIDDDTYQIKADGGKWHWTDYMIEGPVPVYKPGDKVKIREWDDLVEVYGMNNYGDIRNPGATFVDLMRKYCGKILTIAKETQKGNYKMVESGGWCFDPAVFTMEDLRKEVFVAYRDGQEVVGLHKINGETVKKTVAKCHPDDEFDFMVGAKLAMERMKEENQKPDHGLRIGDKVEVVDDGKGYTTYYEWFKAYNEIELGLRYTYASPVTKGEVGVVKAIHPHIRFGDMVVAIENRGGVVYLVAEEGLRRVG